MREAFIRYYEYNYREDCDFSKREVQNLYDAFQAGWNSCLNSKKRNP